MDIGLHKLSSIILIFLWSLGVQAQDFDRMDIPITLNGTNPSSAFVGGLLSPQFSNIDLDGDGKKDLFIFDRVGNVRLTYLNVGGVGEIAYEFAPEYIDAFPETTNWMLLRDYNGDGIEDIFMCPSTPGVPGIEVWTGSRVDGDLQYELLKCEGCDYDILYIPLPTGGETQVYVSFIDLPDIVDIDSDGDLDILSFDPGGSTINYYKNFAVERYGDPNILEYELSQNCFGKFRESGTSQDVELSPDNDGCGMFLQDPNVVPRHSGSTILALDENGDQLMDLILGDLSYNGLVMLSNGGTAEDAWITAQDPAFPSYNTSARINIYNGAFHLDVNNDGNRDLIVAPNTTNSLQNKDHIWVYENANTDSAPRFNLSQTSFLLNDMIDLGSYTYPTFTDVDQDGLMDLVVGTGGLISDEGAFISKLYYFRNTGTLPSPAFVLQDDDYLNFSEFTTEIVYAPAFGDLDGDGDHDCLVGDERGFFFYLENEAGPGNPYDFGPVTYRYQEIRVGQSVVPTIADINNDGLGDIIIGERNFNSMTDTLIGSLNYLENEGVVGSPVFSQVNSGNNTQFFGRVNTRLVTNFNNYSSPKMIPYRDDYLLITGSEAGKMFVYTEVMNNPNGTFEEVSGDFGKIREGTRTAPDIFDIDSDGFYDIVVGNRRGGLAFYSTDIKNPTIPTEDIELTQHIEVYPNPASDKLSLQSEISSTLDLFITNVDGKIVFVDANRNANESIDISSLQSGIYFIEIISDKVRYVSRFVKE